MEETLVDYDESPPLSAQVFEKMKQITQHHTDRYRKLFYEISCLLNNSKYVV